MRVKPLPPGISLKASLALVVAALVLASCQGGRLAYDPQSYRSGLHSYAAGQAALYGRDTRAAADYYLAALKQDPANDQLRDRAFELLVSDGRFAEARRLNDKLTPGRNAFVIARMLDVVDAFAARDYEAAAKALDNAAGTGFDGLIRPIARAWLLAGEGKEAAALEALLAFNKQSPALKQFSDEHRAMILAYLGRWQDAEPLYRAALDAQPGASGRLLYDFAAQLAARGRAAEALALLRRAAAAAPRDRIAAQLVADITAGKTPANLSRGPSAGLAEALYRLAAELLAQRAAQGAIVFARLATVLRPDFDEAYILIGEVHDSQDMPEEAYRAFAAVADASPLAVQARVRQAAMLSRMERGEEALSQIQSLRGQAPEDADVLIALGDLYRAGERFAEAAAAYSQALESMAPDAPDLWAVHYGHGVVLERQGLWEAAEAAFRHALILKPDDPYVLNYLGYSWLDRGVNFREARAMIERAVAQRPDDGFIVDSLGWAYYLGGDFEEAVTLLERASALQPGDPTIADHLGDAYWKVDRVLEARFKWRQALELQPEKDLVQHISAKLDLGLDLVEAQPQP